MKDDFILAIDQGTSATKAVLFNRKGQLISRFNAIHKQIYPRSGWVEHDPEEIYQKTLEAIKGIIDSTKISQDMINVIAITNQRETAVVWDRITGEPIYNAIVWQCQRSIDICNELRERGLGNLVKEKTGLILSPYFSASKVKWILDNVEGAREKADSGQLLFGTMDTWLIWKLTGGKVHATDYSNASRTQLFNIQELKWDEDLLGIFSIPKNMMPEIKSSNCIFGYTAVNDVIKRGIPISGIMGDSHAALFGQNCFEKGMAKATYGTGSSVMMNIGKKPLESKSGIVTSIAWGMDEKIDYVFEGNINCTGATIKWLVEDLELIPEPKISGKLAATVNDNEGVYMVPAFVGLSAPYWDSFAKASITGITYRTKKAHIVRAAEESIAYQIKDIIVLMEKESGIKLKELRVDGGPTRDDFLMQFQADILNVTVVRENIEELSAMGSAFMAGLATGLWKDKEEISKLRVYDKAFYSNMTSEDRKRLYNGWKEAVKRTLSNYNSE